MFHVLKSNAISVCLQWRKEKAMCPFKQSQPQLSSVGFAGELFRVTGRFHSVLSPEGVFWAVKTLVTSITTGRSLGLYPSMSQSLQATVIFSLDYSSHMSNRHWLILRGGDCARWSPIWVSFLFSGNVCSNDGKDMKQIHAIKSLSDVRVI